MNGQAKHTKQTVGGGVSYIFYVNGKGPSLLERPG